MDHLTLITAIDHALEAVDHIVKSDGPWKDKKSKVIAAMDEELRNSFYEFISWFEEDDKHE